MGHGRYSFGLYEEEWWGGSGGRCIFGGEREQEMIYECKKLLGHNFCGTSDAAYASHVSLLYPAANGKVGIFACSMKSHHKHTDITSWVR